jgi:hypothetical protein
MNSEAAKGTIHRFIVIRSSSFDHGRQARLGNRFS